MKYEKLKTKKNEYWKIDKTKNKKIYLYENKLLFIINYILLQNVGIKMDFGEK